mmetsp:Transcript_73487/g.118589  ORF Transcript_73487/g.118589 Transcript_73487/m.118589 type:complete len:269 (-) Transcript_73487:10-816(-)
MDQNCSCFSSRPHDCASFDDIICLEHAFPLDLGPDRRFEADSAVDLAAHHARVFLVVLNPQLSLLPFETLVELGKVDVSTPVHVKDAEHGVQLQSMKFHSQSPQSCLHLSTGQVSVAVIIDFVEELDFSHLEIVEMSDQSVQGSLHDTLPLESFHLVRQLCLSTLIDGICDRLHLRIFLYLLHNHFVFLLVLGLADFAGRNAFVVVPCPAPVAARNHIASRAHQHLDLLSAHTWQTTRGLLFLLLRRHVCPKHCLSELVRSVPIGFLF